MAYFRDLDNANREIDRLREQVNFEIQFRDKKWGELEAKCRDLTAQLEVAKGIRCSVCGEPLAGVCAECDAREV